MPHRSISGLPKRRLGVDHDAGSDPPEFGEQRVLVVVDALQVLADGRECVLQGDGIDHTFVGSATGHVDEDLATFRCRGPGGPNGCGESNSSPTRSCALRTVSMLAEQASGLAVIVGAVSERATPYQSPTRPAAAVAWQAVREYQSEASPREA